MKALDRAGLNSGPASDGGKVHDKVVRSIAQRVLGGIYTPETTIPREDELAEEFKVSRTTIREAIKVLSAKGLIETRQRVGVRVRSRDEWRLLDPAVLSWHPDISQDSELLTDLLEARRLIEPAAAEMAAQRATSNDLATIENAYLGMERALPDDIVACCESDVNFHRAVLYASHNIVLRGLMGTIDAALRATFLITHKLTLSEAQTLHVHLEVFESIRMRDASAAREATNRLLDKAETDIRHAIPIRQATR